MNQKPGSSSQYAVVKITPEVIQKVGSEPDSGLTAFQGAGPGASPRINLGVGDVVSITIFEAAEGGLFIPASSGARPGNFVTIPDQSVDNNGNITMPYAGTIRAAGRSIPTVQEEIVSKLQERAIEPQVVITLKEQQATQVSVLGAVRSAARFPISAAGDRLLDVIAKAGGPEFADYETFVTVQRDGAEATESLAHIVRTPSDNIYVEAGDMIVLSRRPQSFVALGASGKNDKFNFEQTRLTLSEGIGRAGGLLDGRANPTFVVLYRLEDRETLQTLGVPTDKYGGERVPTMYMADLRNPNGFFLASKFDMRDKDILYVATAPSVNVGKVFGFITSGTDSLDAVGVR